MKRLMIGILFTCAFIFVVAPHIFANDKPLVFVSDAYEHHEGEHHGEAAYEKDHHKHAGLDPHIWLSPPLIKTQARTILAALQEVAPGMPSSMRLTFGNLQRKSINWTPI